MNWIQRLQSGLSKTRHGIQGSLKQLLGTAPDPAVLEELEAALLGADLGARVTDRLLDRIRESGGGQTYDDTLEVIRQELLHVFDPILGTSFEQAVNDGPRPFVVMAVGINGVGKTTTVAKLGSHLHRKGLRPLLVAADTFRAAAIEQLEIWGQRTGIEVIRHQQGSDPAAVAFDGIAAARARQVDVVLIDTAGRLHTKVNLMQELQKMARIVGRELTGAPHEILLTLDATLGQNALAQARQFHEALGVTGLVLTKLDGTARGGVVVAIAEELHIPIRFIGIGEGEEDLQEFQAPAFLDAMLGRGT